MTHNTREGIEKVLKRAIKQIAGRIEALHPQYFLDEATYKHDVKGTMDVVKMMMADIDETLHQELQKAREEERKIIKLRIDYDRRKGIPAEETVNDIYDSIELKDQSELDQPNK